jgi:hypothetical protein
MRWAAATTGATGEGARRGGRQKPYSTLKPGQQSLTRTYYPVSTRNLPDGKGYTTNYKRFGSIYGQCHNQNVSPNDYKSATAAKNALSTFDLISIVGYEYSHEPSLLQANKKPAKCSGSQSRPDLREYCCPSRFLELRDPAAALQVRLKARSQPLIASKREDNRSTRPRPIGGRPTCVPTNRHWPSRVNEALGLCGVSHELLTPPLAGCTTPRTQPASAITARSLEICSRQNRPNCRPTAPRTCKAYPL